MKFLLTNEKIGSKIKNVTSSKETCRKNKRAERTSYEVHFNIYDIRNIIHFYLFYS